MADKLFFSQKSKLLRISEICFPYSLIYLFIRRYFNVFHSHKVSQLLNQVLKPPTNGVSIKMYKLPIYFH